MSTKQKISDLKKIDGENISSASLFVFDAKQNSEEEQTNTGYKTKITTFKQLGKSFSTSLDIQKMFDDLKYLNNVAEVPSSLIKLKNSPPKKFPIISAFYDKTNILIGKPETYNMFLELSNIVTTTVLERISAEESPWIQNDKLCSTYSIAPSAKDMVASQYMISKPLSEFPSVDIVARSSVRSELTETISAGYVASQSLITDISSLFRDKYIHNNKITSKVGNSDNFVASQFMVGVLSGYLSNLFPLSDIVSITGNATYKAASQKLATDISNEIHYNYALKNPISSYLSSTDVENVSGDSSVHVASQKLMTEISSICDSTLASISAISGDTQDVCYIPLSSENISVHPIGMKDVFVCEISNEFEKTIAGITDPSDKIIMDFSKHPISVYSYQDGDWRVSTQISAIPRYTIGTLSRNPYTHKMFYITDHNAVKISEWDDIFRVAYRANIPISVFFHENTGEYRISVYENGYNDEPEGISAVSNIFNIQSEDTFVGWARVSTATSPDYVVGEKITEISSMHLYPIFSTTMVNVTFDANGGIME